VAEPVCRLAEQLARLLGVSSVCFARVRKEVLTEVFGLKKEEELKSSSACCILSKQVRMSWTCGWNGGDKDCVPNLGLIFGGGGESQSQKTQGDTALQY
jgi:hypothetical protein